MRFGILGDAKIARERLRPAILNAGHEVVAIGRRDETMSLFYLGRYTLIKL